MLFGYAGKLLEIDLGKKTKKTIPVSEADIQSYLGGYGLGAKILWESVPAGADALSEKNVLLFVTGPLTGTPSPSMRMGIVTKSPQTGGFCCSYVGGHMGPEIKFAGYDGILIRGRADKPTYVVVTNGDVSFQDASSLWGKGIYEAEQEIRNRHGNDYKVASIGPAGENSVSYAVISTDFFRHAGRGGVGAVMGDKKLKALAVRGNQDVRVHDLKSLYALSSKMWHTMATSDGFEWCRGLGTLGNIPVSSQRDSLPTSNFRSFFFENAENIGGEAAERSYWVKKMACFGCPLQCGSLAVLRSGMYKGTVVKGPEYETSAMLGSNCGLGDLEELIQLNKVCDDLGVDTISMGNVIGFVLECYQKGILKSEDLDGLLLDWGDAKGMTKVIEMAVYKRGIGKMLAQGVRKLADHLGGESRRIAMHVKEMEIPGWAITPGMALSYATGNRGADHNDGYVIRFETTGAPDSDGVTYERDSYNKANLVKMVQDETAAYNCLIVCNFAWGGELQAPPFLELLKAATGLGIDEKSFLKIGERSWNLARLFNVREGLTSETDTVPDRFFEELSALKEGNKKVLDRKKFQRMLSEYYRLRGWNPKTGLANEEKLKDLGIEYRV